MSQLPNAFVVITGGGAGYSYYQEGGIPQTSPKFTKTKDDTFFESGITYYFYAEHPTKDPDPRLVRVLFDTNGSIIPAIPEEDINNRNDLTLPEIADFLDNRYGFVPGGPGDGGEEPIVIARPRYLLGPVVICKTFGDYTKTDFDDTDFAAN